MPMTRTADDDESLTMKLVIKSGHGDDREVSTTHGFLYGRSADDDDPSVQAFREALSVIGRRSTAYHETIEARQEKRRKIAEGAA
jgi:hypothetical protein